MMRVSTRPARPPRRQLAPLSAGRRRAWRWGSWRRAGRGRPWRCPPAEPADPGHRQVEVPRPWRLRPDGRVEGSMSCSWADRPVHLGSRVGSTIRSSVTLATVVAACRARQGSRILLRQLSDLDRYLGSGSPSSAGVGWRLRHGRSASGGRGCTSACGLTALRASCDPGFVRSRLRAVPASSVHVHHPRWWSQTAGIWTSAAACSCDPGRRIAGTSGSSRRTRVAPPSMVT
jgi:hypothetical protein